ncbi:hypothetical protein Taro_028461 [Colocasia esculenta]|uniref:Uncharacterized protein n=1 Tax=Colocasia esculenta TaxID=4460 RepID=A0A843VL57_COLES|nr:hypothetical protein [Colocasia esculenta]
MNQTGPVDSQGRPVDRYYFLEAENWAKVSCRQVKAICRQIKAVCRQLLFFCVTLSKRAPLYTTMG